MPQRANDMQRCGRIFACRTASCPGGVPLPRKLVTDCTCHGNIAPVAAIRGILKPKQDKRRMRGIRRHLQKLRLRSPKRPSPAVEADKAPGVIGLAGRAAKIELCPTNTLA